MLITNTHIEKHRTLNLEILLQFVFSYANNKHTHRETQNNKTNRLKYGSCIQGIRKISISKMLTKSNIFSTKYGKKEAKMWASCDTPTIVTSFNQYFRFRFVSVFSNESPLKSSFFLQHCKISMMLVRNVL